VIEALVFGFTGFVLGVGFAWLVMLGWEQRGSEGER